MIEPVELKDFFITFFASALVILAGAGYALLFAWSKTNADIRIRLAAYSAYLVLAAAVVELTQTAHFSGYWLAISFMMLIGYFFAPIGIWHLCVKTHTDHDPTTDPTKDPTTTAIAEEDKP